MKKFAVAVLVSVFMSVLGAQAQDGKFSISGKVTDGQGAGVGFATIALVVPDSGQSAGVVADSAGMYKLTVAPGTYSIEVRCVGYMPYSGTIEVAGDTMLDDIALEVDANTMDEVVVTAAPIVREADRFVMHVAGSSTAIGQSAYEVLAQAPGVWLSEEDGITINGNAGVRVMIGEQILTLSKDELANYLRSIAAEDVQKVEVIPYSGADFDGDSGSGIIRITLMKKREAGVDGSVEVRAMFGEHGYYDVSPTANVNFRQNKLSLYTTLSYSADKTEWDQSYKSTGNDGVMRFDNRNSGSGKSDWYSGKLGAIYDFNDRHTLLGEFYMSYYDDGPRHMESRTLFPDAPAQNQPGIMGYESRRLNGTLNYVMKLDSLGSQFKVVADYTTLNYNDDSDSKLYVGDNLVNLYRNDGKNRYNLFSLDASAEVRLGQMSKIKGGAKFTSGNTRNETLQEQRATDADPWARDNDRSMIQKYRENIAAVYAIFSSRIKRFSYVLGVRGEYTHIKPTTITYNEQGTLSNKRDYFSIFPNANLSLALNEKMSNSLILTYNRSIQRPGYYMLNPAIIRMNELLYTQGDPYLDPSYINSISLSFVLAHRYTLTVGAWHVENLQMQRAMDYDEVPGAYLYKTVTVPGGWQYYAQISAPVQITKWFALNTNLSYIHRRETYKEGADKKISNGFTARSSANFTLPKNFFIEASYWYQSTMSMQEITMEPMYNFNLNVRKRFYKDRFTASFGVRNILSNTSDYKMKMSGEDSYINSKQKAFWTSRQFSFSLRYNFKAGAATKIRAIEKGDDSRIGSGSGSAPGAAAGS